ncbi:MAG: hypothetical protein ACLPPV_00985 [Candidatus Korobacteraceae bacterium]|jgi:hypothetical protein
MSLRRTLFSLLLLAGVAFAQDYGSISGTVFGEDGQPVVAVGFGPLSLSHIWKATSRRIGHQADA